MIRRRKLSEQSRCLYTLISVLAHGLASYKEERVIHCRPFMRQSSATMIGFDSLSMPCPLQSHKCKLSPVILLRVVLRPSADSASGHLYCLLIREARCSVSRIR